MRATWLGPGIAPVAWWLALALLIFAYYLGLATRFDYAPWPQTSGGFIFNQQLRSLLDLRLDIDPRVVANEGFLRDDKTYTYFGIWSALVRLPVVTQLWRDWTTVYCALAATIAALCLLKLGRDITAPASNLTQRLLLLAVAATAVLSGPQIELLGRPSVYMEAVLWAYACGCAFLCAGVPLLLGRAITQSRLNTLATCAAVALLARISTGLSLYIALAALVASLIATRRLQASTTALWGRWLWRPAALLACALLLSLTVNTLRWGKPLEFAPLTLNRFYAADPARLARLDRHGAFSAARLPDALSYYVAAGWFFSARPDSARARRVGELFDGPEGPPIGLVQTQGMWLVLAFAGAAALLMSRTVAPLPVATVAVAAGLAVGPIIIASYHYLAFRYRAEFAPLLLLFAALGLRSLQQHAVMLLPGLRKALLMCVLAGCAAQILLAHGALRAHACTPFGSYTAGQRAAERCLEHGRTDSWNKNSDGRSSAD